MDRPLTFRHSFRQPFRQSCLPFQWLALVGWLAFANAAGAQQFPYVAYVTGEQVYVRSGPGQRYYPTGQIPPGYAVEVYRHDRDGWCAVRPPEGSFSWVASHQVRATDAGIVEVVDDRVVARVGSTLSPNRSAVQVLLPKGERMELLAEIENEDPRWVRVAAPAGEFRWVAASALSRQPPIETTPLPKTINAVAINEPTLFVQADPNGMDVVAGSPAELQLAQFQSQPSPQANRTPPALLSGGEGVSTTMQSTPPRVRFQGLTPPAPPAISAKVGSVEELELRLSQAVVEPPQQWQLDPLEAAASSLLAETKAPPVRAQLREVLERIARFQQVQQRYNNPHLPPPAERDPLEATTELADDSSGLTGLSSSLRARARQDLAGSLGNATVDKPLYDATGLLKPVVSKRAEAPQYALVDERGKVVSFITPTPDLNLKPYVGRRIGVHGKRGFMPEYRRAHVTAGRVTALEGTVWR